MSSQEIGGMYRYQGVGVPSAVDETHKLVDNNYICFGTNNKDDCTNNEEKYMYRIIGITNDGKLKLIKMQPVEENDNKVFQWWSNYTDNIEWPESLLFKRLNGLSNGAETGDLGNTNIFINSTRYEYMKDNSKWSNMIDEQNWMYGDIGILNGAGDNEVLDGIYSYGITNNGLIIYDIETGKRPTRTYDVTQKKHTIYRWSQNINAKIGLMYLHDYYLAYDNIRDWYSNYDTTNWLYKDNNNFSDMKGEWHLTRQGNTSTDQYSVYDLRDGRVFRHCFLKTGLTIATRPVFYLKNDIHLSGKGTIDNPYLINSN